MRIESEIRLKSDIGWDMIDKIYVAKNVFLEFQHKKINKSHQGQQKLYHLFKLQY